MRANCRKLSRSHLRLRGGWLEAAFHSLFSKGGLYGCLYLLWRTRVSMNKYKMTGRHASDIRDNGKTCELPAPGNHGCYAVQPTILIAADRNRYERMTSGGSVCLRSSQDQAASLPSLPGRRANTEAHAWPSKSWVTMAGFLRYDKGRENLELWSFSETKVSVSCHVTSRSQICPV